MKKSILLLLIVLCIILSVSGFVYADEVEDMSCGDHAVWSYDSQTKTLTISGTGPMYNYKANMAPWNGNWAIQHIVVEEGITHIGDFAFEGLSQMTDVSFPQTLESIGLRSFENCSSLEYLDFPSSVTTIGSTAFAFCDGLKSVNINNLAAWCENTFTNFGNPLGNADSFTIEGEHVNHLVIPEGVTKIGTAAFYSCPGLKTVEIPDSVTEIGVYAFSFTDITAVEIPTSVQSIGQMAFHYCRDLETVYFYCGSQEEWEAVSIEGENEELLNAPIEFHKWEGTVITESTDSEHGEMHFVCECCDAEKDGLAPLYDTYGCAAHEFNVSYRYEVESDYHLEGPDADAIEMTLSSTSSIQFGDYTSYTQTYTLTFPEAGIYDFWVIHDETGEAFSYTARIVEHEWSLEEVVKPTCENSGYEQYKCALCEKEEMRNETEPLGHTVVKVAGVVPSCEYEGITEGEQCSVCHTLFSGGDSIPATGHSWSQWEVTVEATASIQGEEMRVCETCGLEETRSIDKLSNPFVDVQAGKFYETPVLWAVENGVTNGMDATHFAPDNICNRGQVVTFLWRAAGSPEPTSTNNPFSDVKEGKFYYKAVLWAVENGITNGTSATTFSPNDNCTRGQVATFLWRTLNEPAASNSTNPFTDVAQGKFYYDAVLWAVDAGVTNGMTATTFAPNNACTRGQIVTFLYRALG